MRLAILSFLGVANLLPQTSVRTGNPHRIEVVLERLEAGAWKAVDPGLVLERNDRVRFRFKSNFPGYLYVTNHSTSDNTTLLFPREDTGSDNRVTANREYLVPATKGAFRVDGPPGYDLVSWVVSPVELGRPAAPALTPPQSETQPERRPSPGSLTPRCDDTIFRARGACIDTAAGPQAKPKSDSQNDLTFIRNKQSSIISSTAPVRGPIVYEFRLAHR
jgi:hypothetical protein